MALMLSEACKPGAKLVVTGCMAERYGDELARALPEADAVVGFNLERSHWPGCEPGRAPGGVRDLLNLPLSGAVGALGVSQGRRGLRPRPCLLRDPDVSR